MTIMHHRARPGHSGNGSCARERRGAAATLLTLEDRCRLRGHMEQCLRSGGDGVLVAGILRRKIARSDPVRGEVPDDLATGGCRVRFMITGGGASSGVLTHEVAADAPKDAIPVCSLVGATLIGMRVLQRALVLRDDGRIDTLALLDVSPAV